MNKVLPRNTVIVSIVVLTLIIGFASYWALRSRNPTKDYQPRYSTTSEKESTERKSKKEKNVASSSPLPPKAQDVPLANAGTVSIVELDQSAGFINAKAFVEGFAPQICVYTFLSEGARPITREVQGDCIGISIPQAEFEKIGTYTLTVSVYDAAKKLDSSPKEINVK